MKIININSGLIVSGVSANYSKLAHKAFRKAKESLNLNKTLYTGKLDWFSDGVMSLYFDQSCVMCGASYLTSDKVILDLKMMTLIVFDRCLARAARAHDILGVS